MTPAQVVRASSMTRAAFDARAGAPLGRRALGEGPAGLSPTQRDAVEATMSQAIDALDSIASSARSALAENGGSPDLDAAIARVEENTAQYASAIKLDALDYKNGRSPAAWAADVSALADRLASLIGPPSIVGDEEGANYLRAQAKQTSEDIAKITGESVSPFAKFLIPGLVIAGIAVAAIVIPLLLRKKKKKSRFAHFDEGDEEDSMDEFDGKCPYANSEE